MKIKIFPILLIAFVLLQTKIIAQSNLDFLNPTKETDKKEDKKEDVQIARRKMIKNTVETLSDREVDSYLQKLEADTSGSIYLKRKRLLKLLDTGDPISPSEILEKSKKPEAPPLVIENAAEGEVVSVDKTKSGVLVLRGNVKIKLQNGTIHADVISVDSEKKELYAEGNVVFREINDNIIRGEKFIYDINLQQGVIYHSKASFFPLIFAGQKIKKLDEKRFALEVGYFTTCNAEVPHYSFKVKKLIIYQDEGLILIQPRFQVGGTTLFWFPMFYTSSYGNGWITQIGKNNTQGTFMQNSYQWSSPRSSFSLLAPTGYKARLDAYEKTGQAAQLEMWRVSPWLNFDIFLGYANYKRYQITSVYEDRFKGGGIGTVAVTNEVDKGQGKYSYYWGNPELGIPAIPPYRNIGIDYNPWSKADINLNSKKNNAQNDGTRNLKLKYENYSNMLFDYEYGNRYQPANSYNAIYSNRSNKQGLIRRTLDWDLSYSENRGDLNVAVNMKRNLFYYPFNPPNLSGYFPTYDVLPSTTINYSTEIARLPEFDTPIYIDFNLNNSLYRYYSSPVLKQFQYTDPNLTQFNNNYDGYKESVLRTQSATFGETGFHTYLNFGSYITYTPAAYIGAQKSTVSFTNVNLSASDISLENSLKRTSYQYIKSNQSVKIGDPILFLTATHKLTKVNKPELQDTTAGSKNWQNELNLSLESYALENWEFSINTIKDLRKFSTAYQPQPTDQQRWYYTVGRVSGYIDFLDDFGAKKVSLLERQRSFYSGIYINNDYVYHTPLNKPLSNQLTLAYQMGGFKLPFLKRIHLFELGGTKYHNYRTPITDSYRVYFKTDVQIWQYIGLELDLDSRATEPWRYTNQTSNPYNVNPYYETTIYNKSTNFGQDIIDGSGVNGQLKRQQTAFNINHFMTVLKLDLHEWEYRLAYSMDLRTVPGGTSGDNQLTFYDQSIYFSVTLKNISVTDNEAVRLRTYRYRKKSFSKVSRSSVSSG